MAQRQDPQAAVKALVERATNDLLNDPDWSSNLEVVDYVNYHQDSHVMQHTLKNIKRRFRTKDAKVQVLALTLLETCVQNCGPAFHERLAGAELWKDVQDAAVNTKKYSFEVQTKAQELIQEWGLQLAPHVFKEVYHKLRKKNVHFPPRPLDRPPIKTEGPPPRPANVRYGAPRPAYMPPLPGMHPPGMPPPGLHPPGMPPPGAPPPGGPYSPPYPAPSQYPPHVQTYPPPHVQTYPPPHVQTYPPPPGMVPPPTAHIPAPRITDATQVATEIANAKSTAEFLESMLKSIEEGGDPAAITQEHVYEVAQQCLRLKFTMSDICSYEANETTLAAALEAYEKLEKVVDKYSGMLTYSPGKGKKPLGATSEGTDAAPPTPRIPGPSSSGQPSTSQNVALIDELLGLEVSSPSGPTGPIGMEQQPAMVMPPATGNMTGPTGFPTGWPAGPPFGGPAGPPQGIYPMLYNGGPVPAPAGPAGPDIGHIGVPTSGGPVMSSQGVHSGDFSSGPYQQQPLPPVKPKGNPFADDASIGFSPQPTSATFSPHSTFSSAFSSTPLSSSAPNSATYMSRAQGIMPSGGSGNFGMGRPNGGKVDQFDTLAAHRTAAAPSAAQTHDAFDEIVNARLAQNGLPPTYSSTPSLPGTAGGPTLNATSSFGPSSFSGPPAPPPPYSSTSSLQVNYSGASSMSRTNGSYAGGRASYGVPSTASVISQGGYPPPSNISVSSNPFDSPQPGSAHGGASVITLAKFDQQRANAPVPEDPFDSLVSLRNTMPKA